MKVKLEEFEGPYFDMCRQLSTIISSLKSMEDKIINTMVKEHDLTSEQTRAFVEKLIPGKIL